MAYSSQRSWLAECMQSDGIMWMTLRSAKSINVDFLIRSATSQSSSYPIFLVRLGGPLPRPNIHLKLWKCRESTPRPYDLKSDMLTPKQMKRSVNGNINMKLWYNIISRYIYRFLSFPSVWMDSWDFMFLVKITFSGFSFHTNSCWFSNILSW